MLTIAGSDSGGGAGVQADARTITALGAFPLTAITAITAQNTRGVTAWQPVAPRLIAAQVAAVMADFPVAAIKTGLLPGAAAVRRIAATLARFPATPLVVDPVMGSTSGTPFLPPAGLRALSAKLLPRATLVTPNWPEAAALTGLTVNRPAQAEAAGRRLAERCGCAVLVKGGHGSGRICADILIVPGGKPRWFRRRRIATSNTHGTGCVLAAAIATHLALGRSLEQSVAAAGAFLARKLESGRRLDWGGRGPALAR